MTKLFKSLLIVLLFSCTAFSQEKGSMMLGVGTSLTGVRISEIMVNPAIGYFPTNNIMLGGNISYVGTASEGFSWLLLNGRYYIPGYLVLEDCRVFAEVAYGTTFSGTSTQGWLGTGMTIRLGSVWFIEPRLVFSTTNNGSGGPLFHELGLRIGGGLLF
jgi:hypothetical protein